METPVEVFGKLSDLDVGRNKSSAIRVNKNYTFRYNINIRSQICKLTDGGFFGWLMLICCYGN
jgi:hypothetical protein